MKKIKQTIALILSVLLLMGMLTSLAFAGVDNPFDDVGKKDWFAPYVLSLYADGIVNGKTTATFDPQANVTRAEFVKMLGAISMVNAKRFAPKGLTDVKAKDWYAGFVAWAIEEGVTNGTSPTTFAPNDNITREQIATILYRYMKYLGVDVSA